MYIFGGQRNKEYATDFIAYDVDTQNISIVNTDNMKSDKNNVPQSGFTQRATIDCERDEIYVLSVSHSFCYKYQNDKLFFRFGNAKYNKKNYFDFPAAEFEQRKGTTRFKFKFILDVFVEDEQMVMHLS